MKRCLGILLLLFCFSQPTQAVDKQRAKELAAVMASNPIAREIVYGKKLEQITSCAVVDTIPWKFRPDGRQARILVRDTMRLNAEFEFSTWEISQVMDSDGFSTYFFRRALKKNKVEAYAVRDYLYNKIIENKTGTQVVESRSIKHLIGKPAFLFSTAAGETLTYYPGSYKNSYIMFSQKLGEGGQSFPQVFVKAMICYRPEESLESLKIAEKKEGADASGKSGSTVVPVKK